MSRSWIIRSRTTSTSRLRGEKEPRRWTSTNRAPFPAESRASVAGLKRSMWPTCRTAPRSAASARRSSASSRVAVIGFSSRTSRPRSRARRATAWWSTVGTATETASHVAEQGLHVGVGPAAVLGRHLGRPRRRRCRRRPRGARRAARPHARVVAPERPHADDADSQRLFSHLRLLRPRRRRDPGRPRPVRLGLREERGAVDEESASGVHREDARAGLPHGHERPRAHDRHVEAHVLPGLRDLDHGRARARRCGPRGGSSRPCPPSPRAPPPPGASRPRSGRGPCPRAPARPSRRTRTSVPSSRSGCRRVIGPASASWSARNATEGRRVMPSRPSASATAPIRLSVFWKARRASTPSSFRSGTMPEKIWRCFDLPGHDRLARARPLQDRRSPGRAGRGRSSGSRPPRPRARARPPRGWRGPRPAGRRGGRRRRRGRGSGRCPR